MSKLEDGDDQELKRKKAKPNSERSQLMVRCGWIDCTHEYFDAYDEFVKHVQSHEPHVETRETDGKAVSWQCCMWDLCEFSSVNLRTARFHINYHAYHTRLKALGRAFLDQNPNLDCYLDCNSRNILPELPCERTCDWSTCDFKTDNYQRFLKHTNTHVTGQPHRYNHEIVYCAWQECNRPNRNMTKLKIHLRTHTQERTVACPTCGTQFASKTKFIDHCARQLPPGQKLSKCSYCKKSFASDRILQDHIRLHVNLHKCPMCDMTCPFRYTLAQHMRYRHLSHRPFKCSFCDHRCTTERDLKTHHQTHCSENAWVCDQPGCDFSCRSKLGLTGHYRKAHNKAPDEYGCHICDIRYTRGAALTVHLKKRHNYRWASGQSRFRYIKDDNGVHRLLMVRYESLEVTEQIVTNATQRKSNHRPRKFSCAVQSPTDLVITEVTDKSDMNSDIEEDEDEEEEENMDDPDELEEERTELFEITSPQAESDILSPKVQQGQEMESDSEFGECLKKHLGLEEGFIQILRVKKNT